jgi:hypothetical protein
MRNSAKCEAVHVCGRLAGVSFRCHPALRVLTHNPNMESDIREKRAATTRRIDAADRGPEPTLGATTKAWEAKLTFGFATTGNEFTEFIVTWPRQAVE